MMNLVLGVMMPLCGKLKMKSKLKAIQILEVMLDKDLNDRKVLDRSDGAVYNGEEWLHIDEAIEELNGYIQNSNREIQSLKDKLSYASLVLREYINE